MLPTLFPRSLPTKSTSTSQLARVHLVLIPSHANLITRFFPPIASSCCHCSAHTEPYAFSFGSTCDIIHVNLGFYGVSSLHDPV
jgi:hypothetical protein